MFNAEILQKQLQQNYFQIYFSPRYEATSSKIRGAEVWIRYHNKDRLLDYKDFSAELERADLIGMLDLWVINQVCQEIKQMTDTHTIPILMNISVKTVCNPYSVYDIGLLLKKYDLPKHSVQLALTSKIPCGINHGLHKGLLFLQRQGVKILLNSFKPDFTGHSSPSPLLTPNEFDLLQRTGLIKKTGLAGYCTGTSSQVLMESTL